MTTRNKKRLAWTLLVILALGLGFVAYNAYTNSQSEQQPIADRSVALVTEQPVSDRSTAITGEPTQQPGQQPTEQPATETPAEPYETVFGGVRFLVTPDGVWHEIEEEKNVEQPDESATQQPTEAPATETPATTEPTTPPEPYEVEVGGIKFLVTPDGVWHEIPATEVPATEVPATEVPATAEPTQQPTEAPATEVPATVEPTQQPTDPPAIIVVTPTDPPVVSATEVPATQQPITQEPTQPPVQPPVTGLTPEQQTALNNVQTQIYAASAAGEVLPDFDVTGSEDLWAYLPNVDYIPANALYSVLRPYFVDVVAHSFNFVFSEAEGQDAETGLLIVLESAQAGNGRLRLANDSANAEKMAALLDKCDPTVASYIMLEWLNEHTVQNPENPAERLFLCTR